MPDQKIIAVVGATGAQGGGLVRAILAVSETEPGRDGGPTSEKVRYVRCAA